MKSLREYGVEAQHLRQALESFKAGNHHGVKYTPSTSTYILCRIDFELWDLKPVVRMALRLVGENIDPNNFTSQRFQGELSTLGYHIVRFDELRQRRLGMRGFDADELIAPHRVYVPPFMAEKRNGFAFPDVTGGQAGPAFRKGVSNRFVRNSEVSQRVRQRANGICGACQNKSFETPNGGWFLEVHHKKWLSEGGADVEENMIALCPNCHRQEHFGKNRRYR
ncbi:HNH endonuclease [Phaeobacter sp. JH18-32]|uniref:HNH endonuclease n=1 Tax=Phaeobacter TaxID=302485 RepID=UPI003A88534D